MRPSNIVFMSLFFTPLFFAAGCGTLGLMPTADLDTGGYADILDEEPVDVAVQGRTYAVELSEATFVEPSGLGDLFTLLDLPPLLFHVLEEETTTLGMMVTLAGEDGQQHQCEKIQALPKAEWNNPRFALDASETSIVMGGTSVVLNETRLDARIMPDASSWLDGALSGWFDAREVGLVISEEIDFCDIVHEMDGSCEACPDGVEACFQVVVEDIEAVELSRSFDLSPDTTGC